MLRYTHIYQLLYRIVGLFAVLFFVAMVYGLLDTITGISKAPLPISFIIFIVCCVGAIYLLNKTTGWVPTYLYISRTLSTEVSPTEAKELSFLFDGSLKNGKWYPLREIRELKPESRREALFQFAKRVTTEMEK